MEFCLKPLTTVWEDRVQVPAYAGIDVGGTSAKLALVDGTGRVLARSRFATGRTMGRPEFVAAVVAGIRPLAAEAELKGLSLSGVALGVPGLVSSGGRVESVINIPSLSGCDLRHELSRFTDLPLVVNNDATLAAYGEYVWGAGRGFSSLLVITLGTGVGGGLILNDRLWTGADGSAGEVGHLTVEPEGLRCSCGNRGCLEQYASASAIVAGWCGGETSPHPSSRQGMTALQVAEVARGGDPRARALFASAGRYLGIAVASITNLLNLEAVVLSGGLAGSYPLFAREMGQEVLDRGLSLPAGRLRILQGELGEDAGVLGGVAALCRLISQGEGEVA
jgi:glucokinase